ncbi:MAG: type II secretion system protein, partial [Alphaproteobacteria bacterium]|nr:type II secretion system protein [Alphaproteobacteria bacterium]
MKNFEIKNQNGRSMIEMLGVLAIIGVLSVGGIAGYSKAMMKYRINKTIEQITLIAGNVRAFWGPQKNYIGVSCYCTSSCYGHSGVDANGRPTYTNNGCPIVKKAKIFPDEMITVTDGKIMSITNPFGDRAFLYAADKAKSGDNQAFVLVVDGVPEEACIEIVSNDWSVSGVKGFFLPSETENATYLKVPADINDVISACTDSYRVQFYFDIDLSSSLWSSFN